MAHYLITGTSSGIGAALSTRLTQAGHDVSGVARRKSQLGASTEKLGLFHSYQSDVVDATGLRETIDMAVSNAGAIDVAILNAGIYQPQDGTHIDPQIYANHMNINYLGVVNALAAIVPQMVQARHGHIAIVSSVAGWRGLPKSAAYGPTKAALISLAESLYFDLTPKGVKLQIICPGFVESEATSINDFEMPDLISANVAAEKIINGMKTDVFSIKFPKSFTRKIGFLRFLPDKLYFHLVGKQTGAFDHGSD
jgi:NADP-dependent 3-hydroxy acid dehydrogenase YdfG